MGPDGTKWERNLPPLMVGSDIIIRVASWMSSHALCFFFCYSPNLTTTTRQRDDSENRNNKCILVR